MSDPVPPVPPPPSAKKLVIGATAVVGVAAVALVGFILPAEYGIDPTGIGKALGVTKLSEGEDENIYLKRGMARKNVLFALDAAAQPDAATLTKVLADNQLSMPAEAQIQSDRYQFELLPYEGIEIKYVLAQGAPMIFSWRTSAQVNYDMHAHPFEGGEEMTESYSITDAPAQAAVYVAPFTGIHGWYWQNRTMNNVTLTLDATGAFTGSKIFDQTGEHDRPLSPPPAADDAEGAAEEG